MTTCTSNSNFIYNGDTFVLISRENGRFYFEDYGVCSKYSFTHGSEKHIIDMSYFSLAKFPPLPASFSLTAEEIIKGKACRDAKTYEFKKFNETFSIDVEVLDQFENMVPFKRKLCQI